MGRAGRAELTVADDDEFSADLETRDPEIIYVSCALPRHTGGE